MAWVRELKINPIIDSLGTVTTWNGTEFEWDELLIAKWKASWSKESKSATGWTREA